MKFYKIISSFILIFICISLYLLLEYKTPPSSIEMPTKDDAKQNKRKVVFLSQRVDVPAADLLAKWFNQETGISVRINSASYESLYQTFIDDFDSKTPRVDVVEIWHPTLAPLVEKNAIINLTSLIDTHFDLIHPNDFFPKMYDAYTLYKDRRWGIPYDVDTHFLFYRPSLLKKYNFSPPRTWDEVQIIAETITLNEKEQGIYGVALMGFQFAMINVSSYLNRLSAYGGQFINDKGEPALDTPEALLALQSMVDLSPFALPLPTETDYEVSRDAFLSGRVAMVDQWTNVGSFAADSKYSSVIDDWDLVPMPTNKIAEQGVQKSVANLNAGFSLVISSHAPNPVEAKEFLLFASRPDIQKRLNLANVGIDVGRLSVVHSEEFQAAEPKISKATILAFEGNVGKWPVHAQVLEMMDVLSIAIVDALEGIKPPKTALLETQKKWVELLKNQN